MSSLKKNLFFNVTYQVMTILIPLVTAPYIARVLGKDGVGIYAFSTSVANYFALFMLLGIGNYGVRTIAQNRQSDEQRDKTFLSIYAMQVFLSVVCIAIFVVFTFYNKEYQTALWVQLLYLLSVALDINWYFAGTEQFKITVTRGLIIKILQLVCIFVFIKTPSDTIRYIAIMTGGVLIGQVAMVFVAIKQIHFRRITVSDILIHLKPNLILFIPILATSVFTIMDKIMLEIINQDISAVGIYENSEKIVKLPLGIIAAIGTVMMPKISNLISIDDESKGRKYFDLSMRYIGILVVGMGFGIAAIANVFAVVFYGNEFLECGLIITMLSIILISSSWANIIRTQFLIPNNRERIYIIAVIAGAVMNLLLNGLLIPRFGAVGAALGTIGAELTLALVHTIGEWTELQLNRHFMEWVCYMFCGIMMLLIVRIVGIIGDNTIWTLCKQIVIGIASYSILIICLLVVKKDPAIVMIKQRIQGSK